MAEARYLYCLTNRKKKDYGNIGIENSKVYSVVYRDVVAVVHTCEDKPYESKNVEKVRNWIVSHNHVIENVMDNKWTVIPFSFDTIIKNENILKTWLSSIYEQANQQFQRLGGKQEYGVGIYLKPVKNEVNSGEIISGKDYLLKKKNESLASEKLNMEIANYRSDIMENVKPLVSHVQIIKQREVPEGFEDKITVVNFSCLVNAKEFKNLNKLLDHMQEKFIVRLTGPWPPYSFVNTLESENPIGYAGI